MRMKGTGHHHLDNVASRMEKKYFYQIISKIAKELKKLDIKKTTIKQ